MPNQSGSTNSQADSHEANQALLGKLMAEFETLYPTESDCVDGIYAAACAANVVICKHCGSNDFTKRAGARICICRVCKRKSWFTSGTLFHRMRAAKPWLSAIWLMEQGFAPNSSSFHQLAEVSQSSALNILKKVRKVIQNKMDETSPTASSSTFQAVICKRSRETPARDHPKAEELDYAQRADNFSEDPLPEAGQNPTDVDAENCAKASGLGPQPRQVYDALVDSGSGIDELCRRTGLATHELLAALSLLEVEGLLQYLPGGRYARTLPKQFSVSVGKVDSNPGLVTSSILTMVLRFIHANFHGISRKYLQNYVAGYWCYTAKLRWRCGALLRACLQSHPIRYKDLLGYVSPSLIKVLPRAVTRNAQQLCPG